MAEHITIDVEKLRAKCPPGNPVWDAMLGSVIDCVVMPAPEPQRISPEEDRLRLILRFAEIAGWTPWRSVNAVTIERGPGVPLAKLTEAWAETDDALHAASGVAVKRFGGLRWWADRDRFYAGVCPAFASAQWAVEDALSKGEAALRAVVKATGQWAVAK